MKEIVDVLEIKEIISKDNNLSQVELSKICGVSKTSVSLWLSGKRDIPQEHLDKVLEYVGVYKDSKQTDIITEIVNKFDEYEEIRNDLTEQLALLNKFGRHYDNLVDHAVYLFQLKDELQEDIIFNGLRIKLITGNGFEKEVDNTSIKNLTNISARLMGVLRDLGLDTPADNEGDYNEEDFT